MAKHRCFYVQSRYGVVGSRGEKQPAEELKPSIRKPYD